MYNPSLFILAFFICCKIQHLGNFADWHRKHIQYTQYCHRKQILFTHSNGNKSVACMNTMRNFGSQLHIQWITWYNIIKKLYIHETSVKGDNYLVLPRLNIMFIQIRFITNINQHRAILEVHVNRMQRINKMCLRWNYHRTVNHFSYVVECLSKLQQNYCKSKIFQHTQPLNVCKATNYKANNHDDIASKHYSFPNREMNC